jgi:hypothetical protein
MVCDVVKVKHKLSRNPRIMEMPAMWNICEGKPQATN